MHFNWGHIFWAAGFFTISCLLSLLLAAIVIVKLPSNYFLDRSVRQRWVDRHPAVRIVLQVAKNLVGLGFVAAGILLSLPGIPGQGILTILIGVLLLDFPGKRRWERKLVGRPRVLAAINRVRRGFGKPPLQLSEDA